MKTNFSNQTKTFIILFVVALIGSYLCLIITKYTNFPGGLAAVERIKIIQTPATVNANSWLPQDSTTTVETLKWKTYTDSSYNFSFTYPPQWQIKKPSIQNGYYVINVDPGAKYFNVKVYISPNGYFAMDNLPYTNTIIAGEAAMDVEGVLYGLKHNGSYYTFDQGISQTIKPEFEALVKSLKFN